jgi:hypothetical protein
VVKPVILVLEGERREENLEKDTIISLHEYELDTGDMKKITEESKWCFSHGFTMLEKTESKLSPLAALAITMAPLRETAGLCPPPPEDEDWDVLCSNDIAFIPTSVHLNFQLLYMALFLKGQSDCCWAEIV